MAITLMQNAGNDQKQLEQVQQTSINVTKKAIETAQNIQKIVVEEKDYHQRKAKIEEQNIRIEAKSGLSQEEIERMKREAEENAEADRKLRDKLLR